MIDGMKLCDECGKRPATYYTKKIINGVVTERYLCEDCKNQHGFIKSDFNGLENLLSAFANPFFGEVASPSGNKTCPSCGFPLAEYLKTGFVGCPDCYKAFEKEILPSVQRLQKDTKHVGKSPVTSLSPDEKKYNELLKQREEAVAREDFGRAAAINEQMKKLKGGN